MVFLYLKLITVYKSFLLLLSMEVLLNVTCVHVCFFFFVVCCVYFSFWLE